jgi:hypothetical protein
VEVDAGLFVHPINIADAASSKKNFFMISFLLSSLTNHIVERLVHI